MKTITLETLKENRSEIIATITQLAGSFNVKEVMSEMVNEIEFNHTDLENMIKVAIYNLGLTPSKRKVTKNATILERLAEMES